MAEVIGSVAFFLNRAKSLVADGCLSVTKRLEANDTCFDFICRGAEFTLVIRRRVDGLQQVIRLEIRDSENGYDALAAAGNRLDRRPVMLADLHTGGSKLGWIVACLLRPSVTADGETNHEPLARGYLVPKHAITPQQVSV